MTSDMDEYGPPKYAQVMQAIRRRIEDGTYPPGAILPSEAQLVREFGLSRPTVVRALETLKLRGIIDREHGRGSFVRAIPPGTEEVARPVRSVLDRAESTEDATITVKVQNPPSHVAALLGADDGEPMVSRQRVTGHDGEPAELITLWLPSSLAAKAGLHETTPLAAGIRQQIQAAGIRLAQVAERLTARHPTATEAKALGISRTAPVLSVLAVVRAADGGPVLAAELVLPGKLHELADTYAL